jgi:hypothetical protein
MTQIDLSQYSRLSVTICVNLYPIKKAGPLLVGFSFIRFREIGCKHI